MLLGSFNFGILVLPHVLKDFFSFESSFLPLVISYDEVSLLLLVHFQNVLLMSRILSQQTGAELANRCQLAVEEHISWGFRASIQLDSLKATISDGSTTTSPKPVGPKLIGKDFMINISWIMCREKGSSEVFLAVIKHQNHTLWMSTPE